MRSIIFIILAVYAGITLFLYFFQSQMIYYPQRAINMTPANTGLVYEEVFFETVDRIKLHGWFVPAQQARDIILICHGNAGNISNRLETIGIFNRLGLSSFIFDYRGYGRSEGKPDEEGTYADAEAAIQWVMGKQNVSYEDIIIFGRSLGGAVAAWLAREHTPKSLILESAFTSIADMGAKLYPWLPVRMLSRYSYSTIDYIRDVNCPILIIHSPDDELVPFSQGKKLFEAANEPKEFLEITGEHNDGFLLSGNVYYDGLDSYISGYAGKTKDSEQ